MQPKQFILNLIEENRKLKEEINMSKKLKENEAEVDTQVQPPQPVKQADGTPLVENEAEKDIQIQPEQPVKQADGTPLVAEKVMKQTAVEDEEKKNEQVDAEKQKNKENDNNEEENDNNEEEDDDKDEEIILAKFKEEIEGDMAKVVEILEAMKSRIEALEKKVEFINAKPEEQPVEPLPPIAERLSLGTVFAENIKPKKDEFSKTVQKIIFH